MEGGKGDDTYFVENSGDRVLEAAGDGLFDRVLANTNYTLSAGAHVESLTTWDNFGTAAINLTGNELANAPERSANGKGRAPAGTRPLRIDGGWVLTRPPGR